MIPHRKTPGGPEDTGGYPAGSGSPRRRPKSVGREPHRDNTLPGRPGSAKAAGPNDNGCRLSPDAGGPTPRDLAQILLDMSRDGLISCARETGIRQVKIRATLRRKARLEHFSVTEIALMHEAAAKVSAKSDSDLTAETAKDPACNAAGLYTKIDLTAPTPRTVQIVARGHWPQAGARQTEAPETAGLAAAR